MKSGTRVPRISSCAGWVCSILRLWLLAGFAAQPAVVAAELAIIETGRPAAELVSVVEPFAAPDGTVVAKDFKLIVDAPAETVAAIRAILAEVDRPLRRLRVSVRQGGLSHGRFDSATGAVRAGERGGVTIGAVAHDEAGVGAAAGGRDWAVGGRVHATADRAREQTLQQVTVLDGRSAHLFIGVDVPYPTAHTAGGVLVEGIEFRRVATGFEVLPRLRGDSEVVLQISPFRESLQGQGRDIVSVQGMATTVSGKLGEWIMGGHIGQHDDDERSGILFRAGGARSDEQQIYFRVEEY